tara:strand:+ start:35234 stop:35659 length:426 start_codon:yes stop_codon:yes gene_type:complete
MAVTTANTLALSDVCLEIYGSSSTVGKSLAGCHTAATGTFNPTYAVAGANTLLDFRGYVHTSSTSIGVSSLGNISTVTACGYSLVATKYYTAPLGNGTVLYSDATLTTLYSTAPARYNKIGFGTVGWISASGVISNLTFCL